MTVHKAIYLAKRHASLSAEAFPDRWRQHSALAASLSGLRGFFTGATQCSRLLGAQFPEGASCEFDGIALVGLRNLESATSIWSKPETRETMQPDELRVFTRLVVESWLAVEEELLQGEAGGSVVVFRFCRARTGQSREWLLKMLREQVAPLERAGEGGALLVRQVHNRVVQVPSAEFAFDVVTECWFADLASARRYHLDNAGQREQQLAYTAFCEVQPLTLPTQITYAKGTVGNP